MSISYWTTDDIHRPANSNGLPTDPTSASLKLNVSGKSFDWYLGYAFSFQENSQTLNHAVNIETFVQSDTYYSYSEVPDLRMVVQVSTNDFSSVLLEKISRCVRTATSVGATLYTREYQNITGHSVTKTCQYRYYNATSISLTSVSSGSQYKIRVKMQYKNGSTWTDCQRTYASETVWKTIIAYAPLYQSITPPDHFYANGINRFASTIYSYYKSDFTDIKFDDIYYTNLQIVRNPDPPYITEGTRTSYLYFCPCLSVNSSTHRETYSFTAKLSRVDPNDSNYYIPMAKRQVSGTVEYLAEDDTSMYGTPTWSISDSKNSYNQYGVLLRNLIFECQLTVSETARYGALIEFSYKPVNASGWINEYITDTQTKTITITIPEGSSSLSLNAKLYGSTRTYELLDIGSQIQIINYYMPSLPTISIHRCDQDGTANDLGAYCRIDWSINVCPINNQNHKTLTINHPQGTTTYTNEELTSYTEGGSFIVEANTENSYTITFNLTDDFNSVTKTMRLSTAHVTMDWLYNGQGVAFGKVSNKENAVEISDDWKLICYDLLFNNVDMNKWIQQITSKVSALEQYIGNIGNTVGNVTQYQVTFYSQDASEFYTRQWVRSGNDATDPITSGEIATPTKAPTTTKTYSFVGWSRSYPSSGATSGALENITANRNIYAAFSTSTRYYTVIFYNGTQQLQTNTDIQYQYSANYSGNDPVNDDGYTFVGWCPSGKVIKENTNARAVFFDNTEIIDDWKTIMQSVVDGTANRKYHVGQYKTLDCGTEGQIKVRIKGFFLHKLAGAEKKARITWEAIECLSTQRRMNPAYSEGVEGTGSLGGWEKSELRTWLNGDFYNLIDPIVRNQIKNVKTITYSKDINGNSVVNYVTADKIFIPSREEITGHDSTRETKGIDFRYTNSSFSSKKVQGTNTNAQYWLRSAYNANGDKVQFVYYKDLANQLRANAETEKYIGISFCT